MILLGITLVSLLWAMIYLCLVIGIVYLVLWILGLIGIVIPVTVRKIIWAIVFLLVVIWILTQLRGGNFDFPR